MYITLWIFWKSGVFKQFFDKTTQLSLTGSNRDETIAELVCRQQSLPNPVRLLVVIQRLRPSRLATPRLSVLLEENLYYVQWRFLGF